MLIREKTSCYLKKRVCFVHLLVRLERNLGVAGADKVKQLLAVLADEGLLVVASDIVPLDAIVVEVVQDGQAGLTFIVFTVVGLRASVTTGVGPVSQSALVSRRDLSLRARPEPSVDNGWLQISTVASVKVAFAAAGPDVLDAIASQLLLDELVLLKGFKTDGVHAVATADVAGVEPVNFQGRGRRMEPAEEVVVSVTQRISPQSVFDTFGTGLGIRQSQNSLGSDGCQAANDHEQCLQQHSCSGAGFFEYQMCVFRFLLGALDRKSVV